MKIGFDSEYSFGRVLNLPQGKTHTDITTMKPECACLHFEDGRELRVAENFGQLQATFDNPEYTFLVHGCHAEMLFCRMAGLRFPKKFVDTFMMFLMVLHATAFKLPGGFYKHASLANLAARYHLNFINTDEKNEIRDAIMRGEHIQKFGMPRVLDYCMGDARACVDAFPALTKEFQQVCGPHAERNLQELFQPYAALMGETQYKGLRLDTAGWSRLKELEPVYRESRLQVMRAAGYEHDGEGIGSAASSA